MRNIAGNLGPIESLLASGENGTMRTNTARVEAKRDRMSFERFLTNRRGVELSPQERAILEGTVSDTRVVQARHTVVEPGEVVTTSTLLVKGFMSRYIDGPTGLRQLVAVHVAGEFVDLHAFPMRELDHSIATLTDAKVAVVPHASLQKALDGREELARKLWFSTLLDAALHRAWLFRVGRLDGVGRVAHFFCEMHARLDAAGETQGLQFQLPMTQEEVGEVCGLTSVHVSRVLRQLREAGLLSFRGGLAEIGSQERLAGRGHFNPQYLYLKTPPARSQ